MNITTIHGRHRQSAWLGFRPVAVLLALFALLVVLAACGGTSTSLAATDEPELTPIEEAAECSSYGVDLYDDGRTLVVDQKGEEDATGASFDQLICVLSTLGMPMSVVSRIDNTRALDGTQTGSWDGYTATWSYHPDSGLNLIVEAQ